LNVCSHIITISAEKAAPISSIAVHGGAWGMIRKSVKRFSENILPKQGAKARDDDSSQSHRAL
jgi:hypothetical protein